MNANSMQNFGSTSESLLMQLKSNNDQDAWSRFVQLYTPLLFYWARRTGLQQSDASDLVQEVLTLVYRKFGQFDYDRSKSFRAWLRTVTLNKHRELCRKKSLGAMAAGQSTLAGLVDAKSAESSWDISYQQTLIAQALEILKPEFQPKTWLAVKQYVVSGRSAPDIAEETGLSVWTIYSAKSRLMARLREVLDGLL